MALFDELLRVNPEVGVQRVRGRLMAAGPEDVLHSFENAAGEVSEVAERIVELSDGSRTVSQVIDALCEEFEVARDVCAADTERFVRELLERRVLIPVNSGTGSKH
jgi:pyrroloquinoline quinone biosynthesis protein D